MRKETRTFVFYLIVMFYMLLKISGFKKEFIEEDANILLWIKTLFTAVIFLYAWYKVEKTID
ncbi:MAG: hypothetical protein GY793_01845 [Proteobacteria bacterium]|nr:hypothetical protein [Pseudomonadota bacterium]